MAEILWESSFEIALDRAKNEGKFILHDFWFDG